MQTKVGIGIDIGGTFTKMAAVEPSGKVLREIQIPTNSGQEASRFVRRICSLVHLMESELDVSAAGVGLGLAGDVDSERGILRFAPSLSGWNNFNFKRAFARRIDRAIVVDNDANMAVWGGYVVELKRRPANVIGVALGTGVGGGVILQGKLYGGSTGSAGEIGHTRIERGGARCRCGGRGCLEAYVGSYGIVRSAKELLKKWPGKKSGLRSLAAGSGKLTPQLIAQAADKGDPVAREVWSRAGACLGLGLANLVLVFNPDVLLILGGVSRAGKWLIDPVLKEMAAQPFRTPFKRVTVRLAKNHNFGCVGAALLALDRRA